MTLEALIAHLNSAGIVLMVAGPDRLRVDAPKGALTSTLRVELILQKADLLAILRGMDAWMSAKQAIAPQSNRRSTGKTTPSEQLTNRALLRILGVTRLPLWEVCRQVSQTLRGAGVLYAALALTDGLPVELLVEELRRVTPCGVQADSIACEAREKGREVLTKERVTEYISAHPNKLELGLKVEDYISVKRQDAAPHLKEGIDVEQRG